jgi:hypothetical protein
MGEDREGHSLDGGLMVQQRGAASADLRNPILHDQQRLDTSTSASSFPTSIEVRSFVEVRLRWSVQDASGSIPDVGFLFFCLILQSAVLRSWYGAFFCYFLALKPASGGAFGMEYRARPAQNRVPSDCLFVSSYCIRPLCDHGIYTSDYRLLAVASW